MPGYWNAHSDRDFEDAQGEPDEGEWREIEIDGLLEEIRGLKATIAAQQRDLDAAAKWADLYEREHGTFKSTPPIPAFMIAF